MRPFFFNQAPLTKPLKVVGLAVSNTGKFFHVAMGQVKATFNLYIIIIFAFFMVGFVIIRPLLKTVEDKTSPFIMAGTLYFMLIGLGFMFMEIFAVTGFRRLFRTPDLRAQRCALQLDYVGGNWQLSV